MESKKVNCGSIFDISLVSQKSVELKEVLNDSGEIQLSAGELQKIDGAGLQLLASFFNEANKLQKSISWIDASDSLIDSARLLGLTSLLKLDEESA